MNEQPSITTPSAQAPGPTPAPSSTPNTNPPVVVAPNPTILQNYTVPPHRGPRIVLLSLVIVLAVVNGGAYYWQHNKVTKQGSIVTGLAKQVSALKLQNDTLVALNNGSSPPSQKAMLPTNQVSLVSNKVVFTLPSGWVKATASSLSALCTGGSFDATASCEDITTVIPSTLNNNNESQALVDSAFDVNVAVYKYAPNKTAKDWLDQTYGADFSQTVSPAPIDESSQPINGNDAFTYVDSGDAPSTIYYAIVHGSYAVVVSSTYKTVIDPTGTANGAVNKDYSQYLPEIKQIVDSITFKS